jgi:hypothetical protein
MLVELSDEVRQTIEVSLKIAYTHLEVAKRWGTLTDAQAEAMRQIDACLAALRTPVQPQQGLDFPDSPGLSSDPDAKLPDAAGDWLFTGNITVRSPSSSDTEGFTVYVVARHFAIAMQSDTVTITDPVSGLQYPPSLSTFTGWWQRVPAALSDQPGPQVCKGDEQCQPLT